MFTNTRSSFPSTTPPTTSGPIKTTQGFSACAPPILRMIPLLYPTHISLAPPLMLPCIAASKQNQNEACSAFLVLKRKPSQEEIANGTPLPLISLPSLSTVLPFGAVPCVHPFMFLMKLKTSLVPLDSCLQLKPAVRPRRYPSVCSPYICDLDHSIPF